MNELVKLAAAAILMRKSAGDEALPLVLGGVGGALLYKNKDKLLRDLKNNLLGLVGLGPKDQEMSPEQMQQLMGGLR